MKAGIRVLGLLLGALALLCAYFQPVQAQSLNGQSIGKVYLMRGLANVFSYGMDTLADKLRARGINATVYEYGQWQQLANDAVAFSRANRRAPIVIAGHSLGADAAIQMAEMMTAMGVAPKLVITFDPVGVQQIGRSGGRFINYYQSNNGFGKRLTTLPGFTGTLVNRNLDNMPAIDHFNIEKADAIQAEAIKAIAAVTRRPPPPPPVPVPAPEAAVSGTVATPAATPASASAPQSAVR